MDLEDLERRINHNADKLNKLINDVEENLGKINENKEQIERNSGALAILHTIKSNGDKYFIIWIITFIAFLLSIGYIVYLKNDINNIKSVSIQQIEKESENGTYIENKGR